MADRCARTQQTLVPAIGILASFSSSYLTRVIPAFRQGLRETGYIDGQNVIIEPRLADGQYDRLTSLAAELLDRKVAVIVAIGGSEPAKVAKSATTAVPIVFVSAADPVSAGIVTSFNRPEDAAGVSLLGSALEAKRLELLHEMVPGVSPIGVLLKSEISGFRSRVARVAGSCKRYQKTDYCRASQYGDGGRSGLHNNHSASCERAFGHTRSILQ